MKNQKDASTKGTSTRKKITKERNWIKDAPWFSVVEWPEGSFGEEYNTEVSHFSSKELCESSLKEYLEGIFEMNFKTLDDAFKKAVFKGFKVWYTKAKVRSV